MRGNKYEGLVTQLESELSVTLGSENQLTWVMSYLYPSDFPLRAYVLPCVLAAPHQVPLRHFSVQGQKEQRLISRQSPVRVLYLALTMNINCVPVEDLLSNEVTKWKFIRPLQLYSQE